MLKFLFKTLDAIDRVTATIGTIFLFVIMIVVFGDVVMRYVFNSPFSWAYDLIALYLMAAVFTLIAWFGWLRAIDSYRAADVMAGAIAWPMWPSIALAPFGATMLALRLAGSFLGNALSLATGRDVVPLPASHVSAEGGTFE